MLLQKMLDRLILAIHHAYVHVRARDGAFAKREDPAIQYTVHRSRLRDGRAAVDHLAKVIELPLGDGETPVSYTHLTLPTIYSV